MRYPFYRHEDDDWKYLFKWSDICYRELISMTTAFNNYSPTGIDPMASLYSMPQQTATAMTPNAYDPAWMNAMLASMAGAAVNNSSQQAQSPPAATTAAASAAVNAVAEEANLTPRFGSAAGLFSHREVHENFPEATLATIFQPLLLMMGALRTRIRKSLSKQSEGGLFGSNNNTSTGEDPARLQRWDQDWPALLKVQLDRDPNLLTPVIGYLYLAAIQGNIADILDYLEILRQFGVVTGPGKQAARSGTRVFLPISLSEQNETEQQQEPTSSGLTWKNLIWVTARRIEEQITTGRDPTTGNNFLPLLANRKSNSRTKNKTRVPTLHEQMNMKLRGSLGEDEEFRIGGEKISKFSIEK